MDVTSHLESDGVGLCGARRDPLCRVGPFSSLAITSSFFQFFFSSFYNNANQSDGTTTVDDPAKRKTHSVILSLPTCSASLFLG
jgi:hypothetical protein